MTMAREHRKLLHSYRPEFHYNGVRPDDPTLPEIYVDMRSFDSSNCHPALAFCLSMIFLENRLPLFRIML